MKQFFSTLLFDESCIHCKYPSSKIFCPACSELIELLDPNKRCNRCFSTLEEKSCSSCHEGSHPFYEAALFSTSSPISSIVYRMERGRLMLYQKALLSYLFIQVDRLGWEVDGISFFLTPILQKIYKGGSLISKLASRLAKELKVPLISAFYTFQKEPLFPKVNCKRVEGKKLLLISLKQEKSHLFALKASGVKELYSLSLFRD